MRAGTGRGHAAAARRPGGPARLRSAPFALAVFMVLGLGFVIAVDRNRAAWLYCTVAAFNVLMWLYLMGPAASVTVRPYALDIRNPLVRHLVPRGRVASVYLVDTVAIRVRLTGDKRITVSALLPGQLRWRNPSPDDLAARLNSFGDAVLGDPAPPDIRAAETRIRWANLPGVLLGAAGLGWLLFAKPY